MGCPKKPILTRLLLQYPKKKTQAQNKMKLLIIRLKRITKLVTIRKDTDTYVPYEEDTDTYV